MTISSATRVAGPFAGDGSTTVFPFSFKAFDASDLLVVTLNLTSGAIATLTLDSDYSATLNVDQDSSPGGTVTLLTGGLAVGLQLMITTATAQLQGLDLANGGGFYPNVVNSAFDLLTVLVQQLAVQLGRALQIPFGDNSSMALPSAALRAGKAIMFDASGNLQLVPIASGSSIVPGAQTAAGTVDSSNKNFTFTAAAGSTPSILVFVGGIFQDPATDYGTPTFGSGSTWQLSFTNAPTNGPIKILMLGD
jgi:hypothetical protein